MPGMMDTVLNLGLNDATRDGLAALTGNERFAWDAHRRFVQMFGRIVMDVPGEQFEHALAAKKAHFGVEHDADLPAEALRELVAEFLEIVRQPPAAISRRTRSSSSSSRFAPCFEAGSGSARGTTASSTRFPTIWARP